MPSRGRVLTRRGTRTGRALGGPSCVGGWEVRDQGEQRGALSVQGHGETQIQAFQRESALWYSAAACQFKETNKNPSQAHTYTELMKLKRQGPSFAEYSCQGPEKWIHLVIRVGTICRNEL